MALKISCWRCLVVFKFNMENDVISDFFCGVGFGITVSEFCIKVPTDEMNITLRCQSIPFYEFSDSEFLPFDVRHEIAIAKLWRFSVDFLVDMHIVEPDGQLVWSQVSVSLVERNQIEATVFEIKIIWFLHEIVVGFLPVTSAFVRMIEVNVSRIKNKTDMVAMCTVQVNGIERGKYKKKKNRRDKELSTCYRIDDEIKTVQSILFHWRTSNRWPKFDMF